MSEANLRTSKKYVIPDDRPVCRIGALTFVRINEAWHQFITASGKHCGIYASCGAAYDGAKILDAWWEAAKVADVKREEFNVHYWGPR